MKTLSQIKEQKKRYKKKSFLSVGKIREYGEMDKITGFTDTEIFGQEHRSWNQTAWV